MCTAVYAAIRAINQTAYFASTLGRKGQGSPQDLLKYVWGIYNLRSHGVGFGARPRAPNPTSWLRKLFVNPPHIFKILARTLPLSSQSGRKQGGLINRPYGCVHMYRPCTYIDYSVWDSSGVVCVPS